MTNIENVIKNLNTIAACCKLLTNIKTCSGIDEEMYADWADTIGETVLLLKEQNAREQCLKTKCVICPHCDNCDVDENGLLKGQDTKNPVVREKMAIGIMSALHAEVVMKSFFVNGTIVHSVDRR